MTYHRELPEGLNELIDVYHSNGNGSVTIGRRYCFSVVG